MSLPNTWHLRRVADTSSKACWICYKPTPSVLITPDNKDHFYVCVGHLKDKGFCSPIIDEAEVAAKKKQEEMDREIEILKKEFEEKQKKKAEKEKEKSQKKDKDKDDDKKKEDGKDEDKKTDKKGDDKGKTGSDKGASSPKVEETPRVYSLHKNFYQMRVDRIRKAEIARRNRERLKSPTTFPSVPTGDL